MKKLSSIILAFLLLSCTFAKDNPDSKTYTTYETSDKNSPVVYFIRDITSENIVKAYDALDFTAIGGAMKNLSIGFGSGTSTTKSGKAWIHSGGKSLTNPWGGKQDDFTEAMAEASKGVCDYMAKKGGMAYINVMNRLSVDCDCSGNPAEPDMHDIGILSSLDPVAIDQACIDLVWTASDSASLIKRVERQNGRHILEHAAKIGLGSRNYRLIELK